MEYDLTEGICLEHLDNYIDTLKDSLDLDDKFCATLRTMKYATSKDKSVYEIKVDEDFCSKYGYVAMVRDTNTNTISCVYALHVMKFKLAKRFQFKLPIVMMVIITNKANPFYNQDFQNLLKCLALWSS